MGLGNQHAAPCRRTREQSEGLDRPTIIVAVTTVAVVGLLVASTMIGTLLLLTHLLG